MTGPTRRSGGRQGDLSYFPVMVGRDDGLMVQNTLWDMADHVDAMAARRDSLWGRRWQESAHVNAPSRTYAVGIPP